MVKNLPTIERSTKIRFGKYALENQAENTIVFNASDAELQATNPGAVYLSPIRFREDFSDPEIVLLMYNKATGEITESGSSASTAVEPPLALVTGFGNTTPYTVEFRNPTTSLTASGNVYINGGLEVQGNVQFTNGTITEIKNTDLVVEDRIIGVAHNNTQTGLDTGIIINYPSHNVGIIHHGDETPKRLSIGYTQNSSTDVSILPDSNNITLDVLGDLKVQNNVSAVDGTLTGDLSAVDGTFTGNVSAVDGTLTGDLSAVDGTFTGNVSAVDSTLTGNLSAVDGTFTGNVSAVEGIFSGNVSGINGSFTGDVSGVNGTLTGDLSVVEGVFSGNVSAVDGTFTGNVSAVDGTLTGDLSAVDGTFTGNVSAFNGNLTGDLSAVDGTFTGNVSGVNGTFTSDVSGVNGTFTSDVSGVNGTFTGDVSGVNGTFTGDVSGVNGTLTGDISAVDGSFTGNVSAVDGSLTGDLSATDGTFTGNVSAVDGTFTGNVSAVDGTLTGDLSAVDGTFTGNVSAVDGTFSGPVSGASYTGGAISGTTGTFSSSLSSAGFTATSAQINGILNTTGNFSVNTNAIVVDATNKMVGIGKIPTSNLDVSGNVYASGLFNGDGGGLSNIQVSSFASDVTLGTDTSGNYVASIIGGDGITAGAAGESATPTVAVDLKTNGGLVIETGQVAVDLGASSITGTLAVADGGTGVTTSTGTMSVVLSDSPTLTGTLTANTANFNDDISAVAGTFTGAVQGASYTGGPISGTTGTFTGVLTVSDNTAGTANNAGALIVSGGIGATGNVYSGDVYASAGLDHSSHIGTVRIGYDGTTTGDATFAQTNNMTSTDYALKQDSSGATKVNAKTGQTISFGINNSEKVGITSGGNVYVDTDTLYVDATNDRVGIGTSSPATDRQLDVVGNVHASGSLTVNRATVTDGMIINAGGVTKKFYSYEGTIADQTTTANANVCLTFTSNIFYAKVVAHLVEDETEFSNMSLEVGGGSRTGASTPNLKLGSVSVFGNTSTNPWNSVVDVSTTAGTLEIAPSSTINNGDTPGSKPGALYNIFVEYITPDHVNGRLSSISLGGTTVKTFNY